MWWQTDSRRKKNGGYWVCHVRRKTEYERYDVSPKGQKRSRVARLVEVTEHRQARINKRKETSD